MIIGKLIFHLERRIKSEFNQLQKNRQFLNPFFAVVLTIAILVGTPPFCAFAFNKYEIDTRYEETHDQINFDNLSVFVLNKDHLVVEIDPTTSLLNKIEAIRQKRKFEAYVNEHPNATTELRDAINSSEYICAISYTDAPVVYIDDHFERVPKKSLLDEPMVTLKASAVSPITSDPSPRYRLTLQTKISRSGSSNPYTYTAKTFGAWDTSISTLVDGNKKPAAGNDFVLQSCPTVTSTTSFSSTYNYSTSGKTVGQQGINYFLTDGGDSWVKYEVVDDPSGIAQLKTFSCTQTFKATSTKETKKINSYYIHTWKSMTLGVSVSGTAGKSGGKPTASVGLSVTPSLENKQWQLYNFVSFNW